MNIKNVTLEDLKYYRDVIAVEAFSISNLFSRVAETFSEMKNRFTTFTSGLLDMMASNAAPEAVGEAKSLLDAFSYADTRNAVVSVPEGFKGDFLGYSEVLLEAAELFVRVRKESLASFASWLANCLANPETLNETMIYGKFKALEKELSVFKTSSSKYYSKGFKAKTKFGDIIRSHSNWYSAINNIHAAVSAQGKSEIEEVKQLVENIDNSLDTLIKRISSGDERYTTSPEVRTAIADHCYAVAQQVELYGIYQSYLLSATSLIKQVNGRLKVYAVENREAAGGAPVPA